MGYVYLVGAYHMTPCGYYKIGVSRSYKDRLNQLQSSSPFQILPVIVVTHSNPVELEQAVLEEFKQHRIRGEWFAMYGEFIKDESHEFEKRVSEFIKARCDGEIIKEYL